jgi:DNA-binding MarR family transcriptional regulator
VGGDARRIEAADRIHSASIHLLRRVRDTDRLSGLSPARLSALSVLVFAGPTSLGALAAAEQVSAPTMSAIVSGLEADELARRAPDPNDRRGVIVHATGKGKRLLQQARRRRVAVLSTLFEDFDEREVRTIARAAALIERSVAP